MAKIILTRTFDDYEASEKLCSGCDHPRHEHFNESGSESFCHDEKSACECPEFVDMVEGGVADDYWE